MFLNVLYAKKIDTTKTFVQGKVAILKSATTRLI